MTINWDKFTWTFAKTMADIPHWWIKRSPVIEADYVELFHTIAREGVREKFRNDYYRYWYPGDGYKYWAMTTDIKQSLIINRAKVDPDGPKLPDDDGVR